MTRVSAFPKASIFRNAWSLGLQLVGMMTGQLGGTLALTCEGGTTFAVSIPYRTRQAKENTYALGPDSNCGRRMHHRR
jgi:two-component sensor histidine kinase